MELDLEFIKLDKQRIKKNQMVLFLFHDYFFLFFLLFIMLAIINVIINTITSGMIKLSKLNPSCVVVPEGSPVIEIENISNSEIPNPICSMHSPPLRDIPNGSVFIVTAQIRFVINPIPLTISVTMAAIIIFFFILLLLSSSMIDYITHEGISHKNYYTLSNT